MAKVCDNCDKRPSTGHNVSHSKRRTLRRYLPNLQIKMLFDASLGKLVKRKICTRCLRTMVKTPKLKAKVKAKVGGHAAATPGSQAELGRGKAKAAA